jgi:hypothetical protein
MRSGPVSNSCETGRVPAGCESVSSNESELGSASPAQIGCGQTARGDET